MELPQKSSATTLHKSKKEEEVKRIYLTEALNLANVSSHKKFSAEKLFDKADLLSEKEWKALFISRGIIEK